MRTIPLAFVLISVVAASTSAGPKKPPDKGFWKILVKPRAKWVMREPRGQLIAACDTRRDGAVGAG